MQLLKRSALLDVNSDTRIFFVICLQDWSRNIILNGISSVKSFRIRVCVSMLRSWPFLPHLSKLTPFKAPRTEERGQFLIGY